VPVRVVVHAEAWAIVSADAIRRRRSVGATLGDLVTRAVEAGVEELLEVDQRTVEVADPLRALQARPVLDAQQWNALRGDARTLGIATSRLVGRIVEREARRLGWR
jgi:hypothetical protein